MNGVPEDLDLDPLVGASVTAIVIGKYHIGLAFTALDAEPPGDRGHIGLEGPWQLRAPPSFPGETGPALAGAYTVSVCRRLP